MGQWDSLPDEGTTDTFLNGSTQADTSVRDMASMALSGPGAPNCLSKLSFLAAIVTYKMIGKAYDVSGLCGLVSIY